MADGGLLPLIDPYAVQRAIEVIKDWSALPDQHYTREDADTVERLLLDPLEKWLQSLPPNCGEMQAGQALAECLTNDIAYGFRYRQKVSAAQLARLETVWSDFQRVVGIGRLVHESQYKSKNASRPRASVTKKQLEDFKAGFVDKQEKNGAKSPERGWKKAACVEFGITVKTLNHRLLEQ